MSDLPGCTKSIAHEIILKTTEFLCRRNYPIPVDLRPYFDSELIKMLSMGTNQPTTSDYCSPSVMKKKSTLQTNSY